MTVSAIIVHPDDTVACLLHDHRAGARAVLPTGRAIAVLFDTPMGHKIALTTMPCGAQVIKYGAVIGRATADIPVGAHVHLHNLQGGLR